MNERKKPRKEKTLEELLTPPKWRKRVLLATFTVVTFYSSCTTYFKGNPLQWMPPNELYHLTFNEIKKRVALSWSRIGSLKDLEYLRPGKYGDIIQQVKEKRKEYETKER